MQAPLDDAFHRWIIDGEPCTNPAGVGTKAALHYRFEAVPPGDSVVLRLRLSDRGSERPPLSEVETVVVQSMHERKMIMYEEADAFAILPGAIGTLEEVIELLSWRRLGLHAKPIPGAAASSGSLPPPRDLPRSRRERRRHTPVPR